MLLQNILSGVTGNVRREMLHGRQFLVAPLSLIVPGVLTGNKGPLLYTQEDIAESTDSWNGIPIVVNHPRDVDGDSVSAREPKVLDKVGIGTVFHANMNGKLTAEGWFDIALTRGADPRILSALENNQKMELSTGLFTEDENTKGVTDTGEEYQAIARNYRPDHLAILPDSLGACSIDDGCGLNVNVKHSLLVGFTGETNEHSHSVQLDEFGFGSTGFEEGHFHMIDEFSILESDGHSHSLDKASLVDTGIHNEKTTNRIHKTKEGKYQLLSKDGKKVLGTYDTKEEAEKRERQIRFFKKNEREPDMALNEKDKKTVVDGIIANCDCYTEEDRKALNEMEDRTLTSITVGITANEKVKDSQAVAAAATKGFTDPSGNQHTWNEKNQDWEMKLKEAGGLKNRDDGIKELTKEQFMKMAPPSIRSAVENWETVVEKEKKELVERLVSNLEDSKKDSANKVYNEMTLDQLRPIAPSPPRSRDNWDGDQSWDGASGGNSLAGNKEEEDSDDVACMTPPDLDFDKTAA